MSGTSLAPQGSMQVSPADEFWNDRQLAVLRHLGVDRASNADLMVFHHVCQRTGLDPFAKQIYMIQRKGKQTIQTGIDGFRLVAHRIAERTGEPLSIGAPEWCDNDGQWHDVWLSDKPPAAARITVQRGEGTFTAVALWREYVQTDSNGKTVDVWAQRSAGQLSKCSEALALRKAFPQDLAGIYMADEMGQDRQPTTNRVTVADIRGETPAQTHPADDVIEGEVVDVSDLPEADENMPADMPVTPAQLRKIGARFTDLEWTDRADRLRVTTTIVGRDITSSKDLTMAEASHLIDTLAPLGDADELTDLVADLTTAEDDQ